MHTHRTLTVMNQAIAISSLLLGAVTVFGTPVQAQEQSKLSVPFAKAALSALHAIESDSSAPRDEDAHSVEMRTTGTIDAAEKQASTDEEKAVTELLHQIYQSRLHDNRIASAYRTLMEIETAEDESDDLIARKHKDQAVAQFADGEIEVMNREEVCFRGLEQSLIRRSSNDVPACSEWIRKVNTSIHSTVKHARPTIVSNKRQAQTSHF